MIECRNAFCARNAHFARADLHVLDVLLVDLVAVFRQHDAAAIVETLNVRAGDADINAANHDVALLLGIDHGFVHAFHGRLEIDDLAFAHAARRRLAHAENLDRAVGPAFADDDTNLRGANFETDHQIATRHFSFLLSFLDWNRPLEFRPATDSRCGFGRGKRSEFWRRMHRKGLHQCAALRSGSIVSLITSAAGFVKRDRNVSLHEQVHGRELALRIVGVNQELLEPLQLRVEIVETERDPRVVLVRDEQAITFRNIDLANLKTRLHEAARAQAQELERGFRFERFDDFSRLERLARASRNERQSQIFRQQLLFFHQNSARVHQKSGVGRKWIGDLFFARDPGDRFALGDS